MSPMRKDPFAKQPSSHCFAGWTGNGERSIFLVLSIVSMSRTTPVPSVTKHEPISGPGPYDAGHRCARQTYDCRHWRAGRPTRYTTENKHISRRGAGTLMKFKQGQIIQTPSMPLVGWYLRWIPWIVSGFACVGYLSGVLTTQPLTLLSLLLLTGTYGAWLVIYHIGLRRFEGRPHPFWLL